MPSNFDEAFAAVQSLTKDFDAQKDFYLSPKYQEAEVRKEFIDKFLIALGWDVNHDRQKNPYEQEVKIERKEHGMASTSYTRPSTSKIPTSATWRGSAAGKCSTRRAAWSTTNTAAQSERRTARISSRA